MAETPQRWVDRLFERFTAIFGAQKVAGMWAGAPIAVVKQTWAEQLGRLDPDMVRFGLQRCVDNGLEWPPTLPEFVALCRQPPPIAAHQPAMLPPPVSREHAAEHMRKVRELMNRPVFASDPMFWAKYPKSVAAVNLLVQGAEHNHRLAAILQEHFNEEGRRCRSDEAMNHVIRISARLALAREPGSDDE